MPGTEEIAHVGFGVVVALLTLAPASALLAWLLRRSRIIGGAPVAAIVGGVLAGTLLGATVLSKAAPDAFAMIYIGGERESEALETARRGIERDLAALAATGVTPEAVEEHRDRVAPKLNAYADRVAQVRSWRAMSIDAGALALGCAWMALGAGWAGRVRRRHLSAGAVASGFGIVACAGAPICLAAAWLGGAPNTSAWALGAALGIGSAWPACRARGLGVPGRSPETDASALVACCIGLAAIAMAVFSVSGIRSVAGAWTVALIVVAVCAGAWRVRSRRPRSQRRAWAVATGVVTPTIAALCVAPIDIPAVIGARACLVASIAAVLFASDGRWFGAWLGWRYFGDAHARRQAWRRGAAALSNHLGGITLITGALGRAAGLIDDSSMVAIVLGAFVVESTDGLRRRLSVAFDAAMSPGAVSGADDAGADDSEQRP